MTTLAERIFETVKTLPDQQAAEVLDFVEHLKTKQVEEQQQKREKALATLDKYRGLYDGSKFDRAELYERS